MRHSPQRHGPRPPGVAVSSERLQGPIAKRFSVLTGAIRQMLTGADKRDMARAVAFLSEALTRHRGSTVRQDYLAEPIERIAYIAYFLPRNVLRLLAAWRQSAPSFTGPAPVIEDWGAGPMTALLALWVARGDDLPKGLIYRPVERNGDMLDLGQALADVTGASQRIVIAPRAESIEIDEMAGDADAGPGGSAQGRADVLFIVAALNEWLPARGRSDAPLRALSRMVRDAVKPGGELFVLEPGSRLPAWGVMTLRKTLIEQGGSRVLAPCTHQERCPLLDPRLRGWCHFRGRLDPGTALAGLPTPTLPGGVPAPRASPERAHGSAQRKPVGAGAAGRNDERSDQAGIDLAFSYLHVRMDAAAGPDAPGERGRFELARVIGQPMKVGEGRGVYACAPPGRIVLATEAPRWPPAMEADLHSGATVSYPAGASTGRDRMSGARIVPLGECRKPGGVRLGAQRKPDRAGPTRQRRKPNTPRGPATTRRPGKA